MKKRLFALFIFTLGTITALSWDTLPAMAAEKPNIVVMMVDNLGWGELGCYGGGILRGAPTPRLDGLADEGLRFLNFNVEPQCTPSRSAFMTGRHPIRSGTTKVVWGMLYGMTQWERIIPAFPRAPRTAACAASRATSETARSLFLARWSAMARTVSARFVPVSPSGTGKTLIRFSSPRWPCAYSHAATRERRSLGPSI